MLLTKKASDSARDGASAHSAHARSASPLMQSLRRGLSNALPTMNRRAFLRRSGMGVGVGLAASQLTLIEKSDAAEARPTAVGAGNVEVRRTVCSHCSVGCASDAVVENGVWVRQEPVFDSPINLGAHCASMAMANTACAIR